MKKKVTACVVALSLACQTAAVPLAVAQLASDDADSKRDAEIRGEDKTSDVSPLDQTTESLDAGSSAVKEGLSSAEASAATSDGAAADGDASANDGADEAFAKGAVEVACSRCSLISRATTLFTPR